MMTTKCLFRLLIALVMLCVAVTVTACGDDASSSSGESSYYGGTSGNTSGGTSGTYYEGGGDTYGGGTSDASGSPWLPPVDEEPDPVFDPNADPNAPEEVPAVNPFVSVAHDPFSTFAADVDTASYEFYLGSMQYGQLPPRTTVRLEEFVNYFHYDYPAPEVSAEVPFAISVAAAQNPFNENTSLLRVGIQGEEVDPRTQFEGKNIVFLVDTSGSMSSPDKLPLVQELLNETLTILEPTDTVSIVSYAGDVAVRLVPTPVSQAPTIRAAVNGLLSGGGTWGEGGIQLAYQQAEAGMIEGGLNHIILCTDGDFNIGVSNTDDLVTLIEEKRRTGITLTVLGFGLSRNGDDLMEAVSNAGNGVYGVVYDRDQAVRYVHERMIATLVYIAKDMKIQLEFNPEFVRAFRLLGYENRAIADEDFRNDAVDAGEVGSGHQVTALYELVLVDAEVPTAVNAPAMLEGFPFEGEREVGADELVRVKVRYKHVQAAETDPAMEVAVGLSPAQMMDATAELDADLGWAIAVAAFAEQLKGSPYALPAHQDIIRALATPRAGSSRDRATFLQNLDLALSLIPAP
jgi:Ca-activated chloride channel homolog